MRLPTRIAPTSAGDTGVDVHDGTAGEIKRAEGPDHARAGNGRIGRIGRGEFRTGHHHTMWAMGK